MASARPASPAAQAPVDAGVAPTVANTPPTPPTDAELAAQIDSQWAAFEKARAEQKAAASVLLKRYSQPREPAAVAKLAGANQKLYDAVKAFDRLRARAGSALDARGETEYLGEISAWWKQGCPPGEKLVGGPPSTARARLVPAPGPGDITSYPGPRTSSVFCRGSKRTSFATSFRATGWKSSALIPVRGKPGYSIRWYWHENGRLRQRTVLRNRTEHGSFRLWHDNGQLQADFSYADGLPDGVWRQWNRAGKLQGTFRLRRGTGFVTTWHENGKAKTLRPLRNGKPHGTWKEWAADGRLQLIRRYRHGRKLSEKRFPKP